MMELATSLEREGYCIIPSFLSDKDINHLREITSSLQALPAVRNKKGTVYGVRDLLRQVPALRHFVQSTAVRKLVEGLLEKPAQMVRAIYFDKTPEANWKVAWHQDTTIATQQKQDVTGFSLWTLKADIPHVRPPVELMQRMVTLRIHLDACDEQNGALKVIAGTHKHGILADKDVAVCSKSIPATCCIIPAGGVLAMKPLLLHASSAGASPSHRRVLHFEFSPDSLPQPLQWYDAA